MKFEVELNFFMPGKIRTVNVPIQKLRGKTPMQQLDQIFWFGQNDNQPQELPSVSMGDVIRFKDQRYMVLSVGFKKLKHNQYVLTRPKLEDVFQFAQQKHEQNNKHWDRPYRTTKPQTTK
jgi:hypothetical protein